MRRKLDINEYFKFCYEIQQMALFQLTACTLAGERHNRLALAGWQRGAICWISQKEFRLSGNPRHFRFAWTYSLT